MDHALSHSAPNVAAETFVARVAHLADAARDSLAAAAAYASRYANQSRRDVQFGVGERVLLSTRNLKLIGSPKFR